MAEFYQSEDEQVEAIKKWWRENGKSVIGGAVIGIGAVLGWNYWQDHQEQRAGAASQGFERLAQALATGQREAVLTQASALREDYSGTPYASLAAFAEAREHVQAGDLAAAKEALGWAIQHAPSADVAAIARLRLARVWLAEGEPGKALEILDAAGSEAYVAAVAEVRGDALRLQGEREAADAAYERASIAGSANRRSVEMKRAELGLAVDAATDQ